MNIVGHSKALMSQTMKGFNPGGEHPSQKKQSLLYTLNPEEILQLGQSNANVQSKKITFEDPSNQNQNKRVKLQKNMLNDSKVNNTVARELINARPQFSIKQMQNIQNESFRGEQQKPSTLFDYKKTLLDQKSKPVNDNKHDMDETRSVRSEFDYSTKKKFVEMVSYPQKSKLVLPQSNDRQDDKDFDKASQISRRTGLSFRSGKQNGYTERRLNKTMDAIEPIPEQPFENEGLNENQLQKLDAKANPMNQQCNECQATLNEDEVILNQRFVERTLENQQDPSFLPLCIKCHFDFIIRRGNYGLDATQQQGIMRASQYNSLMSPYGNNNAANGTQKKLFFPNIHMNSEEFKDLGTLHLERRNIAYYPLTDLSQQKVRHLSHDLSMSTPQAHQRKWKQNLGEKLDYKYQEEDKEVRMQKIQQALEKEQLKAFCGVKLHQENQKLLEFQKSIGRNKYDSAMSKNAPGKGGPGSHVSGGSQASKFPNSTNREAFNPEIFEKSRIMDRSNFKRSNIFSAYVNAMFNGGVFIHPAQDQC